jgi:protein required for attachment to host cells
VNCALRPQRRNARWRALADLRHTLHADVKSPIVGEIDEDLAKHPVWEIERHILERRRALPHA